MKRLLIAVCALAACSDGATGSTPDAQSQETIAEVGGISDAGPDVSASPGCSSNSDCGDGWCTGPMGCGVPWSCTPDIPCSAAAPFTACTCAGEWKRLAAGCPEEPYAYIDGLSDRTGPCDPDQPFLRYHLAIAISGYEAFVGQKLFFSVHAGATLTLAAYDVIPANGILSFDFKEILRYEDDAWTVSIYVDADGDSTCNAGDPVWTGQVDNPHSFTEQTLTLTVQPGPHPASVCDKF